MPFVNVAIPVPLHQTFTYSVSDENAKVARPGMRVVVPFKKMCRIGYIVEINVALPTRATIKEIASFPDEKPAVSEKILKLIKWISDYYRAPIGEVFAMATPNILNSLKETRKKRRMAGLKYSLDGFQKYERITLNKSQVDAWKTISQLAGSGKFSASLIHGVTGSGKTELYLRLIEMIVKSGGQVILLAPEISLVPQLAGRVTSFISEPVAIYHSGLTESQRLNQWQMMRDGTANIVIGTRSALFAPFGKLGAIIIDEEHDHSYKQQESPRYNARDTAIMRAKIEDVPIVLGSATPSIESLHNAKEGKYHFIHLPERHGKSRMPEIKIVNMRSEPKSDLLNPHLSIELADSLEKEIKKGHQVMLFLNRRGYANFFICRDCGFIPECPNCNISLTFHKTTKRLRCHYCDYNIPAPDTCPKCKGTDIIPIGSGTEMIEEVIRERLPTARIARLDRDTTTTEKKRRSILSKMHKKELDILIGTQMITKGHDFPNVTLVGIISADQSIHFPDFRSSERTFQLITQVSGRAGRDIHPGKVIIQTYSPEHTSIENASRNDLDNFVASELVVRKELLYPPFSRIANIRITGNKENSVVTASKNMARILLKASNAGKDMRLLGPAPAPLAMIRGKTRWQILIKSPSAKDLATALFTLQRYMDSHPMKGVRVDIDVDPVSMM